MSIETQELADNIRATARSINSLSYKLREHWHETQNEKSRAIGLDLLSQSMQLDDFAKEIESAL